MKFFNFTILLLFTFLITSSYCFAAWSDNDYTNEEKAKLANIAAANIPVTDANSYTDETTVEGWLDELDSLIQAIVSFPGWADADDLDANGALNTDSVSANELNATGVETELENVLDLEDLQGAVTDGQVPNDITVDLAATVTTNANLTGEVTSVGNATTIADSVTVTGWALGASTATTPAGDDNDTSLATTGWCEGTQDYLKTSENGDMEDYANVVTIATSGAEYTTIQAALTANTTANTLFLVYPGTYANDTINFTANNQCVKNAGKPNTTIITNAAQVVEAGDYTNCSLIDINIQHNPTTAVNTVEVNDGSLTIIQSKFTLTTSSTINGATQPAILATTGTGTLKTKSGEFYYYHTGDTTNGIKAILNAATGSTMYIWKPCRVIMTNSGTATASTIGIDAGTAVIELTRMCNATVTDTTAGIVAGLGYIGGSGDIELHMNHINAVGGGSNTCYGIYNSGTGTVKSTHSDYDISAGANNYSFYTGANATIESHFDDVDAADGYQNNGTLYMVSSDADGDLKVTGTAEAGTFTEGGNAVYNSSETPGGELGGTWASPTIDDNVTVTGWALGASTATTAGADDNDTSLATTGWCEGTQDYLKSGELDTSAKLATMLSNETGYAQGAVAVFTHNPLFYLLRVYGGIASSGVIQISEDQDDGNSHVSLMAQAMDGDTTFALPADNGDAGEQLQTDGSGNTSWEPATTFSTKNEITNSGFGVWSNSTLADYSDANTGFSALHPTSTCTDPDDDTDITTGWTDVNTASNTTDADGKTGKSLKILEDNTAANPGAYATASVTAGHLYQYKGFVKADGSEATYRIQVYDVQNTDYLRLSIAEDYFQDDEGSNDWSEGWDYIFEAPTGCTSVRLYVYSIQSQNDGNYTLFDNITFSEVTPACIAADADAPDTMTKDTTLDIYRTPYGSANIQEGVLHGLMTCPTAQNDWVIMNSNVRTEQHYIDKLSGQTVTFSCWVKSSTANDVRIQIYDDGGLNSLSSYHTGGGSLELLTVTGIVSSSITQFNVYLLHSNASPGNAYWSKPMLNFGSVAAPYTSPSDEIIYFESAIDSQILDSETGLDDIAATDLDLDGDSGGTIPKNVKSVLVYAGIHDAESSGADVYLRMRAHDGSPPGYTWWSLSGLGNDRKLYSSQWVPVSSQGDIEYNVETTASADTFDLDDLQYIGVMLR